MNLVRVDPEKSTRTAMERSSNAAAVPGVRLASGASRSKYVGRDDLTLVEITENSSVCCLFTSNQFCAAPVTVAKNHLSVANTRYMIINAGNANAGTGAHGEETAIRVCEAVARLAKCSPQEVLPFSTGVIGEQLDDAPLRRIIPDLLSSLSAENWSAAASAILTTDMVSKICTTQVNCGDTVYTVTGIAKGSGMIKPNMATMLAYVATDAKVDRELLYTLAKDSAKKSFNRITVDGDTSTNDAFALIATGRSASDLIATEEHDHYYGLAEAVTAVCRQLAQDIVRDGEGATKFVAVHVKGGRTEGECLQVAYAIAESPLVKTAFFAGDPNWGRILAAVGRSGVQAITISDLSIAIGGHAILEQGKLVTGYIEADVASLMRLNELELTVGIGSGDASTTVWTCDLSYDYVKINAEYRS